MIERLQGDKMATETALTLLELQHADLQKTSSGQQVSCAQLQNELQGQQLQQTLSKVLDPRGRSSVYYRCRECKVDMMAIRAPHV